MPSSNQGANRSCIMRIGCISKSNPKQIRQKDGYESTAVSSVSVAYPKRIRQRDGNDLTAVSRVLAAYRLRIQSEYAKGMETNRLRYQAYRLRIGCVSKRNPRCIVEVHGRQTDFGLTMTVVLESFELLPSAD
jgi:hypothetical protein